MKPKHLRCWSRPIRVLSDVPVSRNWLIYKFSYKFDTVIYQFLQTGTSDGTLIGLDQLLKSLGFSLIYNPFHFSFTDPLRSASKFCNNIFELFMGLWIKYLLWFTFSLFQFFFKMSVINELVLLNDLC